MHAWSHRWAKRPGGCLEAGLHNFKVGTAIISRNGITHTELLRAAAAGEVGRISFIDSFNGRVGEGRAGTVSVDALFRWKSTALRIDACSDRHSTTCFARLHRIGSASSSSS